MTCPVSKRFLDDLGKASEYGTPERTIEDARRDCGAIRRKLIEHACTTVSNWEQRQSGTSHGHRF
jgi:hypothetical protein